MSCLALDFNQFAQLHNHKPGPWFSRVIAPISLNLNPKPVLPSLVQTLFVMVHSIASARHSHTPAPTLLPPSFVSHPPASTNCSCSKGPCACSVPLTNHISELKAHLQMAAEFGQGLLYELDAKKKADAKKTNQLESLKSQLDDLSQSNLDLLNQSKLSINRLQRLSDKLAAAENTIDSLTRDLELAESQILKLTHYARNSEALESQVQFLETIRDSLQKELADVKIDKTNAESQWRATEQLYHKLSHQYTCLEQNLKDTIRPPPLPLKKPAVKPRVVSSYPRRPLDADLDYCSSESTVTIKSSGDSRTLFEEPIEKESPVYEPDLIYQPLSAIIGPDLKRSTSFDSIFSHRTAHESPRPFANKHIERPVPINPQVSAHMAFAASSFQQANPSASSRQLLSAAVKPSSKAGSPPPRPNWSVLFNKFKLQRKIESNTNPDTIVSAILSDTEPQNVCTADLHDALDSYLF